MPSPFSAKLQLVLKLLSMSGARLASELAIDKSVVSRWLKGSVQPSDHNLSRLSALVATRVEGFRTLDWEREPESLAAMFGVDPESIPSMRAAAPAQRGLPIAIWDQMVATAAFRGASYEGFFKATRPHPMTPGLFVQDWGMIRLDANGLPRLTMGSAGVAVDGWMLPLNNQIYCIASNLTSGSLLFGIFNGMGAERIDAFDGLVVVPGFDMGRSPVAVGMLCERVANLSGDREADDRRCVELMANSAVAEPGVVPAHIQAHLVRDIGPEQAAMGGDWILTMPLARSLSRGASASWPIEPQSP